MAPLLVLSIFTFTLTANSRPAQAFACCGVCFVFDCVGAAVVLIGMHALGEALMEAWIEEEFEEHRDWLIETFFREELGNAMARFTNQMSATAMQQVLITGAFLDAKHQLETQRLFQQLKAQAHKDYQPSEDFCWFGTNVRSMAHSELRGRLNSMAMSRRSMSRHLGTASMAGATDVDNDRVSRWARFVNDYCDPKDNNWQDDDSGLELACGAAMPAARRPRVNRDIDYTRLIDEPRTINANFTNAGLPVDGEEEDIIAMGTNLYGHQLLTRSVNSSMLTNEASQQFYLWLRSVAAQRSVAENSYNAIVGLKTAGTSDPGGGGPQPQTREYMAAIMNELGVDDENGDGDNEDEIYEIIGERPSYYAQLEILSKRIYQNPDFYANLYDKPANVERKATALRAVDMMLERAMFESQLRREMLISVLLSAKLRKPFRDTNQEMVAVISE